MSDWRTIPDYPAAVLECPFPADIAGSLALAAIHRRDVDEALVAGHNTCPVVPRCRSCSDTGWIPGDDICGTDTRCCCGAGDPLPASTFDDLDLATQDRLTKRGQIGMAGQGR